MVLFSIIFILAILITIQHLINWVLRLKLGGAEFLLTVIGVIISVYLSYYLITWSIDWFLEMGWVSIIKDEPKPMLGFAFFGITVIIISIQHLNNWLWRNFIGEDEDEETSFLGFVLAVSLVITVCLIKFFIIWGGSLINGVNYVSI